MKVITLPHEHGNITSSLDYVLKHNIPKNARILDIGCGYGSLIRNLYENGYSKIVGVDIDSKRLAKGKKAHTTIAKKIREYDGKKLPFKNDYFDVVLMFDVIEHIPRVENFLRDEVKRVMKKGGMFIFQTPNKYINIPWEIINQRSFTKWKSYHCSLQTRGSLNKMLRKAGFKSILIEKNVINTKHNKQKIRKNFWVIGTVIITFLDQMPLLLYPNFWGATRK